MGVELPSAGVTLILGIPGTGKSSLVASLVSDRRRQIHLSPTPPPAATHYLRSLAEGVTAVVDGEAERADHETIEWSEGEWVVWWDGDPDWEFLAALDDYVLVVDDADQWWQAGGMDPWQQGLVTKGRKRSQTVVFASQYPMLVPPVVRSCAVLVVVFALTEQGARRYCERSWGITPPDVRYHYRYWRL